MKVSKTCLFGNAVTIFIFKMLYLKLKWILQFISRDYDTYIIKTSKECMCHIRNIAMSDYWTDRRTNKVIAMCRYASQATQQTGSERIPKTSHLFVMINDKVATKQSN